MRTRLLVSTGLFLGTLALSACGEREASAPAAQPAATTAAESAGGITTTRAPPTAHGHLRPSRSCSRPSQSTPTSCSATCSRPRPTRRRSSMPATGCSSTGPDRQRAGRRSGEAGICPSTRALLQFPEIIDMRCMKMDWTTQDGGRSRLRWGFRLMRYAVVLGVLGLGLAGVAARAEQHVDVFPYYMVPDSDRETDDRGVGGRLIYGWGLTDHWFIEAQGLDRSSKRITRARPTSTCTEPVPTRLRLSRPQGILALRPDRGRW